MQSNSFRRWSVLCAWFLLSCGTAPLRADDEALVGHWKLAGDARDASGKGNHGKIHGASPANPGPGGKSNGAMGFDGRTAFIEVPSSDSLNLGTNDFTMAVWANTDESLDDALGDLVSKFDPVSRRGISWCIKNTPGTSGSQSNYRNVHLGIDADTEPKWTDCGRPGNSVYVMALAVHEGELFAGTCEPGREEAGHVYRYAGGERWVDCGHPDNCNAISCLASYDGKLYAGSAKYRLAGSSLPESPNTNPGGRVFRYEGDGHWTDCGKLGETEAIGGLVTFRGELYGSSMYPPAGMFRYRGNQDWGACPLPKGAPRVASPAVFNGALYAISYDACAVFRFDGNTWSEPMTLEPKGQTYSLEIHAGQLFASTWPNGHVYSSVDGKNWTDTGRLGNELESMGMAVHNGKLYAGTLPLAEVHRYDGDGNWTNTGQLDHTPDVRYRRAWSMAVYQGRLFCGVLPSGHVHALAAGASVTDDHALKPGWRHLAATRQGNRLTLFIDGKSVATTVVQGADSLDLRSDQPLKIGYGGHDYFNGRLSDLRLYRRALGEQEISSLATPP